MELISRTEDGFYRLPAFIDAHVHVESSHLTPARFGRLIAAQGTLTAICDPHEIVNVMGEAGLDFMLADARRSPANLRFTLPSCVPAIPFETSGAALSRYAANLLSSDGIVNCIRTAVRLGMDPERAVALATINPARHYGLSLSDALTRRGRSRRQRGAW